MFVLSLLQGFSYKFDSNRVLKAIMSAFFLLGCQIESVVYYFGVYFCINCKSGSKYAPFTCQQEQLEQNRTEKKITRNRKEIEKKRNRKEQNLIRIGLNLEDSPQYANVCYITVWQ